MGKEKAHWISPELYAPLIAFAGALVGLLVNGLLQRNVDQKNRNHAEMAARATAYAELWRIWRETSYSINWVERDSSFKGGMIWIPVFRSIYPNKDNLARIAVLTAKEVCSITSAYYVYQESMVFIKAASFSVLPLVETQSSGQLKRRAPFFSLDEDSIEYVYKIDDQPDPGRRLEVLKWLRIAEEQVNKALHDIQCAALDRFPNSDLSKLIEARAGKLSDKKAHGDDPVAGSVDDD